MTVQLAYCTNVHAGVELDATIANLERHALAVQRRFCAGAAMGVGLWFAAPAARVLRDPDRLGCLARWLAAHQLVPFTLNGFPYGDFHQEVVKYAVYQPDWSDPRRLQYTLDLIHALDGLLPVDLEGSISTLPVMWGAPTPSSAQLHRAAQHLCRVTDYLAALEADAGRLIYLCLEPEPGCVLQRSADVVRFFDDYLLPLGDESFVRRYLRVCHDTCHAAVMFEDQAAALQRYADTGIQVGKVQISAAIEANFEQADESESKALVAELAAFVEPRYLHQTAVQSAGMGFTFFDDLPTALAAARRGALSRGCWRIHFHVPIYLAALEHIRTTRQQISVALDFLAKQPGTRHFEVETYAWSVLPKRLRTATLAAGIAHEMEFAADMLSRVGLETNTARTKG